ncbi:ROK family transcriptional regulator [Sciscionella sediminilitoris]|uniref:ROK family transcriptional regulator n=1 Tax=Sciscionella sediminilitoris TaxID=1445613 RepID=UPI00056A0151|nr:ROK family transcriptional regulator [Sciscionella sp. SE31]
MVDSESPSAARVLQLVASGAASSRTELATALGVAQSTVSLRVQELLRAGVLTETGHGRSQGGRRPRTLAVAAEAGYVCMADLGGAHTRIGVLDIGGRLLHSEEIPLGAGESPQATLDALHDAVHTMLDTVRPSGVLLGAGIGLPGPVQDGAVTLPSRMPGWRGFDAAHALRRTFDCPVVVDNDANLMAIGEARVTNRGKENLVVVKAGSGIGSGVIVGGALYRGNDNASGDISHMRVAAGADLPCSCGIRGCFAAVASGAALVEQLRAKGMAVESTSDVVRAAENAEPEVITTVRAAGSLLGEVLATIVNFFNPDAVLLGGALSTSEAYVAAVRAGLYDRCLPLSTRNLEISRVRTGADAGLFGAGLLVLDTVLDERLAALADSRTEPDEKAGV